MALRNRPARNALLAATFCGALLGGCTSPQVTVEGTVTTTTYTDGTRYAVDSRFDGSDAERRLQEYFAGANIVCDGCAIAQERDTFSPDVQHRFLSGRNTIRIGDTDYRVWTSRVTELPAIDGTERRPGYERRERRLIVEALRSDGTFLAGYEVTNAGERYALQRDKDSYVRAGPIDEAAYAATLSALDEQREREIAQAAADAAEAAQVLFDILLD